jgi:TonB family protein
LRQSAPRLVAVVAGRRDDGELLMDLINRGHVYRFLLKPVSPGRARLAIEASIKHHLEADDKSFKQAAQKAKAAAAEPRPNRKPVAKAAPPKKAASQIKSPAPAPMNVSREDSLLDEGLEDAFDDGNSFTETMTGIVVTVGKKLSDVAETITSRTKSDKVESDPVKIRTEPAVSKPDPVVASPNITSRDEPARSPAMNMVAESSGRLMQNPKVLGIAAAVVIAIVVGWFALGSDDAPPDDLATPPSVAETDIPPAQATPAVAEVVAPDDLLTSARDARDAGQLISPPGANALELFVAASQAAPEDSFIAAELDAVIDQVFAIAESAILTQELAEASTALQLLHFASPDNPRLPFLSAQLAQLQLRGTLEDARVAINQRRYEDASTLISNAKILVGPDSAEVNAVAQELSDALADQQLGQVLESAHEKLAQNQLIAPANDNARFYYQLALANDPDNAAAREGLVTVASKLVLQANVAIGIGQFTNAEDLLRNARALDPSNAELTASSTALENAKSAELKAAADAEANRIAEQERIAENQRLTEQERIAEADRKAEQERIAEAERQAEEDGRVAAAAAAAVVAASSTNADTGSNNDGNSSAGAANESSTARQVDEPAETQDDVEISAGAAAVIALNTSSPAADPVSSAQLQDSPAAKTSPAPVAAQAPGPEMVAVSSLTRTNYVGPKYPRSARRRNVTGSVDISFVVLRSGIVSDVLVTNSTPGTVFNQAALDAVAKWRFEPTIENGQPVEKRTAVRLAFDLK